MNHLSTALFRPAFLTLALSCIATAHAQTHGQRFAKHSEGDEATFCVAKTSPVAQSVQHISAGKGVLLAQGKPLAQLLVHKNAFIGNLSALRLGDALFFVVNEDFGGTGGSKLCKTSADGKTLHWCKPSGSFNAELSAHQGAVYVSSLGGVAKFDAQTGKTLWQHTNLYDKDEGFTHFRQAQFESLQVKFFAGRSDKPPFSLATVDDATGKISLSKAHTPASALPPDYVFDKSVCTPPAAQTASATPSVSPSPAVSPPATATATPSPSLSQGSFNLDADFFAAPLNCAAYDKPNKDNLLQHIHCAKDRTVQVMNRAKRFDLRDTFSVNTPWADIARTCKRYLPNTKPHAYSCQDASKSWVALIEFADRPNPNKQRGEARDVMVWISSIKYATCASPDAEAEFQKVYRRFGKHDVYDPSYNDMIYHAKGASERMKVTHTNKGMGSLGARQPHPSPRARVFDYSDSMIACPGNYSLEFTIASTQTQYAAITDYFKSLEHSAAHVNKGKF